MTAVAENTETTAREGATGRVARVIGPVVDVEFSVDTMQEMYNALNRISYGNPTGNRNNRNFLVPTEAAPMRSMQLGVRYTF